MQTNAKNKKKYFFSFQYQKAFSENIKIIHILENIKLCLIYENINQSKTKLSLKS